MSFQFWLKSLNNKTGVQLAEALAGVPDDTTSLDLSGNDLGNQPIETLTNAFALLPPHLTLLDVSDNGLETKTAEEIDLILSTISPTVTTIKLGANNFYRSAESADHSDSDLSDEAAIKWISKHSSGLTSFSLRGKGLGFADKFQLVASFKAISSSVVELDLGDNFFEEQTTEDLAAAFAFLPAGLTFIDLSDNHFASRTAKEKDFIFSRIPKTVTIKLGANRFLNKKVEVKPDALPEVNESNAAAQAFADSLPPVLETELVTSLANNSNGLTSYSLSGLFLGWLSGSQLERLFPALSGSVSSFNLSENHLGKLPDNQLAQALKSIPRQVTELDLSENNLGILPGIELGKALACLHQYLTSLDLTFNNLGDKTGEELIKILAGVPQGVHSLNLSQNGLNCKTGVELGTILKNTPPSVHVLDLSGNYLGEKSVDELVDALKELPPTVTELDLGLNGFESKTEAERERILSAIPKTVISISLDNKGEFISRVDDANVRVQRRTDDKNELMVAENNQSLSFSSVLEDNLLEADFAMFLEHVRTSNISVDLSNNDLGEKPSSELVELLNSMPLSALKIELCGNFLYKIPSHVLAAALKNIRAPVTSMDLSDNGLGRKDDANLAVIIEAMPSSTKALTLISNELSKQSHDKLAVAFGALSPNMVFLDLSNNGLEHKSDEEKALIFSKIPKTVTTIRLGANNFYRKTDADLAEFADEGLMLDNASLAEVSLDGTLHNESFDEISRFLSAEELKALANELDEVASPKLKLTEYQAKIAQDRTSLDLSKMLLGFEASARVVEKFSNMGPTVALLNLSNNSLDNHNIDELLTILRHIPSSVTALDLSLNGLENKSPADFSRILLAIPSTVARIALDKKGRFILREDIKIPEHVADLGAPDVSDAESQELIMSSKWAGIIAELSEDGGSLIVGRDSMGYQPGLKLDEALQSTPARTSTLYLGIDDLEETSVAMDALVAALAVLPPTISALDLSYCDFSNKVNAERIVAAIPESVTSIALIKDNFMSREDIYNVLSQISDDETLLDLSKRSLGYESSVDLADFLGNTSPGALDLSDNYLGNQTIDELVTTLKSIPASVTHLDLSLNGFEHKSTAILAKIFRAIPKTVAFVRFDKSAGFTLFNADDAEVFEAVSDVLTISESSKSLVRETINEPHSQTNYSFSFDCLTSLAKGACVVAMIVATLVLAPVVIGVGLGLLTADGPKEAKHAVRTMFGFFSQPSNTRSNNGQQIDSTLDLDSENPEKKR